jgi:hypothetical protein
MRSSGVLMSSNSGGRVFGSTRKSGMYSPPVAMGSLGLGAARLYPNAASAAGRASKYR